MSKKIILISIDNLRYDCIGYQPYKEELKKYDVLKYLETPTLDRIASESVCFTQCISTNTYTTAAHASVLTGLYPPRHGVRSFYETRLSGDVFTLAEVLKVHGYETVMMTDMPHLFRPLGLDRGFSHFFQTGDEELINFFRDNRGKKIFALAHFFDIHEPFLFSSHPSYQNAEYVESVKTLYENHNLHLDNDFPRNSKHCRSAWRKLLNHLGEKDFHTFFPLYVRGVTRFDTTRFSGFIKGLDNCEVLDDTLLLIFSDHGEGKTNSYDPRVFAHGGSLFDNVIRVPLLIRHKDFAHRIVDHVVSVTDIFTTVFNFALSGSAETRSIIPYRLDGVDLIRSEYHADRVVYSETWQNDNRKPQIPLMFLSSFLAQRSLRTENAKYIINGRPEIFLNMDELDQMSDEKFIQNCYRGLLCRFEEYSDYIENLHLLKNNELKKHDFLTKIKNTFEYLNMQHYLKYDLIQDPFEDSPLPLKLGKDGNSGYLHQIFDASKSPAGSEEIFDDTQTIDRIADNAAKSMIKDIKEIMKNKHILSFIIDDFIASQKIDIYDRAGIEKLISDSEAFGTFLNERFFSSLELESASFDDASRELREIKNSLGWKVLSSIFRIIDTKIFPHSTLRGKLWSSVRFGSQAPDTSLLVSKLEDISSQKKILAVTYEVPAFNKYSGANRFLNLMEILVDSGFHVTLLSRNTQSDTLYVKRLKEKGISVIFGPPLDKYLGELGKFYDFVILHTPSTIDYIDYIKKHFRKAKIIFDTSDLHYLRLQREGEITGDIHAIRLSAIYKQQEFSLMRKSDIVFVVSEKEREILVNSLLPVQVEVIPNIHRIDPTSKQFQERKDILFIGSFSHGPNQDAILFFLQNIFPKIYAHIDMNIYIIGSSPSQKVLKYQSPHVIFTGFVPDVRPYFEKCRLMVAPLRYGAGVKGKLTQSMSMGLPFVTTSVGAEGMDLADGYHCFIVDNPKSFSDRTIELYESETLWQSFRANSLKHAAERYSYEVVQNTIRRILV